MPNLRTSPDDRVAFVDGQPIGHYTDAEIQPDTGSKMTQIDIAEGSAGTHVGSAARSRPGSGFIKFRDTSPDLKRLALKSANGESANILIRVVKNFAAYSYTEVGLTDATLGPVPTGPGPEMKEINMPFSGTGYYIN